MSSAPKEIKRHGPTEGMEFTREQAKKLFNRYLNKKINWFETIEGGLNNLLFFIECENDEEKYVLKICGDALDSIKTESEVAAMILVSRYTKVPIPKVLAYSSNKNNEFGVEWILMTRTPGRPLRTSNEDDDIWTKLSIDKQKLIINDLVEYVNELYKKIPHSNKIGNYKSDGQIGPNNDLLGPWNNYNEYFYDQLKQKIDILNKEKIFDPVRDDIMKSINEFKKLTLPQFNDLPNVFTHNDLGLQNLTVDKQNKIQGIIDWEWSGSYPICEEYFRSYKPVVYNDKLKIYLYEQLEKHSIPTPRTIPNFSLLQKLYDFLQAILPWYLTGVANPEHPIIKEKLFEARDKANKLVQQIKDELK